MPHKPIHRKIRDYGQLEVVQTHDVTIATFTVTDENFQQKTFTGDSKRMPGDKNIPLIGHQLAVSRALSAASDFYRRQALARDMSVNGS